MRWSGSIDQSLVDEEAPEPAASRAPLRNELVLNWGLQ